MVARQKLQIIVIVSVVLVIVNLSAPFYSYHPNYSRFYIMDNYFTLSRNNFNVSVNIGKTDANWTDKQPEETSQNFVWDTKGLVVSEKLESIMENILNYRSKMNNLKILQELGSDTSSNPSNVHTSYVTFKYEQIINNTRLQTGIVSPSQNKLKFIPPVQNLSKDRPDASLPSIKQSNISFTSKNIPAAKPTSTLSGRKVEHRGVLVRDTICNVCFAHNFKYIINNENICKQVSDNQKIELIIMILTKHENFEARKALRETWLSYSKQNTANVRYVFLLGEVNNKDLSERVVQENKKYNDIVKEDFIDTYMNLTYKTIMGFKWVVNYCSVAKYVMKTDDDMYINIPNILHYTRTKGKTLDNNIAGSCHEGAPNRNVKSKWYASLKAYKESKYPGFCSGTAYFTSMTLASHIYTISLKIPFFHLEDVYIGLCLKRIGGYIINLSGFHRDRLKLDPCLYRHDTFYSSHYMTPSMLLSIWKGTCKNGNIKQPKS